ncbi:ABC transporter substrate-binding protein [Clostridium uliginosum]|uniref:Peptide/nickel transport system substrate-binding protein n=1 Tax=Clostridium uliginosum TaxID=119641 RepID=A0A1I1J856_9CLOT|nr:ABC transporter substrate-binding protein [Clostridium uliginosum]SFC44291.1 peptide/nickel transport system substrate-binding protein [Clostridium uliginosum]
MKKYLIPISLTFIVVAFLLGFVEIDKNSISNKDLEHGITYGISKIPTDLKNTTTLTKRDEDVICSVSKGLVSKDIDNKIMPSLANEINQSKDGIEYEFKLKDDIFWSDGTKITPNDVVTFFKELLKEEDEENISALLDVYGAKDFKEEKTTFEKGVAITIKDNGVIIRLNKKNDNFLNELSNPQYRIRKYLIMWSNIKNNYNKLVYSGDYIISSFDDQQIKLKKNIHNNNNSISNINIIKDNSVELSMASFEIGERDIVVDPPQSELNKLNSEGKLITVPKTMGAYLVINNKNDTIPLQGRRYIYKNVSKALEDYESLNDKRFELAEGSYFREDKNDLTKLQSRKVISNKEEEWNNAKILTLLCKDNNDNRELCRCIENWFKNNTGIFIKYSLVKDEEFEDQELQKRYDMILINNDANTLNKKEFYSQLNNYLSESEKEKLLNQNYNLKNNIYENIESNLFENYRILPLVFYNENIAFSNNISNIKLDGNGNIDFVSIK